MTCMLDFMLDYIITDFKESQGSLLLNFTLKHLLRGNQEGQKQDTRISITSHKGKNIIIIYCHGSIRYTSLHIKDGWFSCWHL